MSDSHIADSNNDADSVIPREDPIATVPAKKRDAETDSVDAESVKRARTEIGATKTAETAHAEEAAEKKADELPTNDLTAPASPLPEPKFEGKPAPAEDVREDEKKADEKEGPVDNEEDNPEEAEGGKDDEDEDDSDAEVSDDELAALQAEAGTAGEAEEVPTGRGRRTRGKVVDYAALAKEQGLEDEDDDDE